MLCVTPLSSVRAYFSALNLVLKGPMTELIIIAGLPTTITYMIFSNHFDIKALPTKAISQWAKMSPSNVPIKYPKKFHPFTMSP